MKPRFSILAMFGITAWVALSAAAVRYPFSRWVDAVLYVWITMIGVAAIQAAQATSKSAVFSRGFFFAVVAYGMFSVANEHWLGTSEAPHSDIAALLVGMSLNAAGQSPDDESLESTFAREEIEKLAFCDVSLISGVVGGCAALCRYRVLERRANQAAVPLNQSA